METGIISLVTVFCQIVTFGLLVFVVMCVVVCLLSAGMAVDMLLRDVVTYWEHRFRTSQQKALQEEQNESL